MSLATRQERDVFTSCTERREERSGVRSVASTAARGREREREMTHTHRHDEERIDIVRTALSMISMFSHIHKCTARTHGEFDVIE